MRSKELTTVVSETLGASPIQVGVTLPVRPRRHESGKGGLDLGSTAGRRSPVSRITKLMALAIKFQDMVDRGEVGERHLRCVTSAVCWQHQRRVWAQMKIGTTAAQATPRH
jgi:hypothetical protein